MLLQKQILPQQTLKLVNISGKTKQTAKSHDMMGCYKKQNKFLTLHTELISCGKCLSSMATIFAPNIVMIWAVWTIIIQVSFFVAFIISLKKINPVFFNQHTFLYLKKKVLTAQQICKVSMQILWKYMYTDIKLGYK